METLQSYIVKAFKAITVDKSTYKIQDLVDWINTNSPYKVTYGVVRQEIIRMIARVK